MNISDDDSTVTLSAGPSAGEPSTSGSMTLSRSGYTSNSLTVGYTFSGSATAGVDFTAPGSVTFPAGSGAVTLPITVIDDNLVEPTETVTVTLASGTGYTVGAPSSATIDVTSEDVTVTVSVADATAGEPLTSLGTATFTFSALPAPPASITVNYSLGGSASGTDYNGLTGSVVILAGSTTTTATITVIDDNLVEGTESVIVTLAGGAGYAPGAPSSTSATIADDDSTVTISATDPAAGEPLTGSGSGTFTLTRTGFTAAALAVNYAVTGSATSGSDFAALPGTASFSSGVTTATITVSVLEDNMAESAETVVLTLSGGTGYAVGTPSSDTVTLADDDSTVTISATDSTAGEPLTGLGSGMFTVTRVGFTGNTLTVNYSVSGTAASGLDYTALPVSVSIASGATTATLTVNVSDDSTAEPGGPETVIVTFSAGTGYQIGTPNSATVTIDDDEMSVIIAATDVTAGEPATGAGDGTFTLTRTGFLGSAVTVNYSVSGGATGGSDYTSLSGTVSFLSGASTTTITVTALDDSVVEGNESVIVTLAAGAGYGIGTPSSATVTIQDDEPNVSIAATDPAASEPVTGDGSGTFTVTRSGNPTPALTVNYTVSGAATPVSDYTALTGSVSLASGVLTTTITVAVLDDTLVEPDETVIVTLAAGTGYAIGTPSSATVSIRDDEPLLSISATDATAGEPLTGSDTGTFTVTRSGSTVSSITVYFTTGGTATAGSDYSPLAGSVTLAAGTFAATITISPIDDTASEGNETVSVSLSQGAGYSVGSPSNASVIIEDDETTVSIVATDANASEPFGLLGNGEFTVTRTGPTGSSIILGYTVAGVAMAGSDYSALSGSVTIPAGQASETITVSVFDDALVESSETVVVTLTSGLGYDIVSPSEATVTIVDDERPSNDDYVNAIAIIDASAVVSAGNVNASKESGEPDHAGNTGGSTVWWAWTAPTSGMVTIDTFGSTFNTILSVYTGSAVSVLTQVAANDDAGAGQLQSQISFDVTAGTTYYIVVDGWGGATGGITLTLAGTLVGFFPPADDAIGRAGHCGSVALDLLLPLALLWLWRRYRVRKAALGIPSGFAALVLLATLSTAAQAQETIPLFADHPIEKIQQDEAQRSPENPALERQNDQASPFIDLGQLEMTARLGLLWFSKEFEADPSFCGGLSAHAPLPWFSRLLGMDEPLLGAFASLAGSRINREYDPEPTDPSGTLIFANFGIDLTLFQDDPWTVSVGLGGQYANYGGVTNLDDGFGLMVGATAGYRVATHFRLTYSPELVVANAGDKLLFNYVGLAIDF